MSALIALIRKDLLVEFRSKETTVVMAALAVLLCVVASFGVGGAFLDPSTERKLYPVLLWLVFVFSATVSIGRSYEFELEHMGIEGLILAGVEPWIVYCSKVLVNFVVVLSGHLTAIAVLTVMLNVSVLSILGELLLLSSLVAFAYSELATLLAAMTRSSRLKNLLLPLILLPMLFPVFFAALELTSDLIVNERIAFNSLWFSLLMSLNVVYALLGVNLYQFVVRD